MPWLSRLFRRLFTNCGGFSPLPVAESRCTEIAYRDLPLLVEMERGASDRPWGENELRVHMNIYRSWAGRILWLGDTAVAYIIYVQLPKVTYIARLVVIPLFRGRGYAAKLLAHVRSTAIGWGRDGCQCLVRETDLVAQKFLQHAGFRCIYLIRNDYADGRDCLVFYRAAYQDASEVREGDRGEADRGTVVSGMREDHLGGSAG